MSDFGDMYRPSEEHEAFRAAVRELCEEKVAPNAAEADELAQFPKASFEALVSADFHAPHIPEAYSGVGADALATVIVIGGSMVQDRSLDDQTVAEHDPTPRLRRHVLGPRCQQAGDVAVAARRL